MDKTATIIPIYSPLDGVGQHWNDHPECWNGGGFWQEGYDSKMPYRKFHQLWNVKEVEKTAEIKDNFGFDRFKVYLYTSEEATVLSKDELLDTEDESTKPSEDEIPQPTNTGWRVTVTSLLPDGKWEPIFDSELFSNLNDASKCYSKNVKDYSHIAKVETQHCQDIRIYAEKIGYHHVEECCANCRWCHLKTHGKISPMVVRRDKFHSDIKHLEPCVICTNYKIFAKRITDVEKPDFDVLKIQPEVDPGCVCSHFEKRLPPNNPAFPNHCYDQYGDELKPHCCER